MRHALLSFVSGISLVACAAVVCPTLSGETFTFTAVAAGTGLSAVGTLTGIADPSTPGAFDITGGEGTANGTAFQLVTPGSTSTASPVNVIYNTAGGPY